MSLAQFIKDLHREECEFKIEPEVTCHLEAAVTSVVKDLIPASLGFLPGSSGRFSVQEVSNAGSYFEQTKIIAPDEYDFMLVIRELSQPDVIDINKGCRDGYVKVTLKNPETWHMTRFEQTPNRSFLIAVLEFNSYVRQALNLFDQGLEPFRSEYGELMFKYIVSRGKPYKQFSFVQTAYFEWKYNCLPTGNLPGRSVNDTKRVKGAHPKDQLEGEDLVEIVYSRKLNVESVHTEEEQRPTQFDETIELDIDLMACIHVPLTMLSSVLPKEALENPQLAKNGCHIVLKPCGSPRCVEGDTECRLISYTKSEQELMRNLHPNWKMVYKFMKWVFHFSDILGVDSYKLKTAVLHISEKTRATGNVDIDTCMRSLLRFLVQSSSRNHMPSFFNPTLNVWNISPRFKHFVKWEMELLYHLLIAVDKTPLPEYDYNKFRGMMQVKIEQFCEEDNVSELNELEGRINPSEFEMFCVQGNVFVEVVRGMERELKELGQFKRIAFMMKLRVLVDLMWESLRLLGAKVWGLVRRMILVYPRQ